MTGVRVQGQSGDGDAFARLLRIVPCREEYFSACVDGRMSARRWNPAPKNAPSQRRPPTRIYVCAPLLGWELMCERKSKTGLFSLSRGECLCVARAQPFASLFLLLISLAQMDVCVCVSLRGNERRSRCQCEKVKTVK
jgi:hypothetical protein